MATTLKLEIVTPERILVECSAEYVTIPGSVGELGILPGHLPIVTKIDSGVLSYSDQGKSVNFAIHHGFAEVFGDQITVLAKDAEQSDTIDADRSKATLKNAETELEAAIKANDNGLAIELQEKIKRAESRIAAAE